MISLALVRVGFISTLVLAEFDVIILHNRGADPGSDCRGLLGSTPATKRCKGGLCRIKALEIAAAYGGSLYRYPGAPRA